MKNKDLIAALQSFPPDMDVAIFDFRKNILSDLLNRGSSGIYEEFEIAKIEPEPGESISVSEKDRESASWIALGFANEDFEDDSRSCRVCGCTELDCRQCIEKTGKPCHWVEEDLCSACVSAGRILLPGADF